MATSALAALKQRLAAAQAELSAASPDSSSGASPDGRRGSHGATGSPGMASLGPSPGLAGASPAAYAPAPRMEGQPAAPSPPRAMPSYSEGAPPARTPPPAGSPRTTRYSNDTTPLPSTAAAPSPPRGTDALAAAASAGLAAASSDHAGSPGSELPTPRQPSLGSAAGGGNDITITAAEYETLVQQAQAGDAAQRNAVAAVAQMQEFVEDYNALQQQAAAKDAAATELCGVIDELTSRCTRFEDELARLQADNEGLDAERAALSDLVEQKTRECAVMNAAREEARSEAATLRDRHAEMVREHQQQLESITARYAGMYEAKREMDAEASRQRISQAKVDRILQAGSPQRQLIDTHTSPRPDDFFDSADDGGSPNTHASDNDSPTHHRYQHRNDAMPSSSPAHSPGPGMTDGDYGELLRLRRTVDVLRQQLEENNATMARYASDAAAAAARSVRRDPNNNSTAIPTYRAPVRPESWRDDASRTTAAAAYETASRSLSNAYSAADAVRIQPPPTRVEALPTSRDRPVGAVPLSRSSSVASELPAAQSADTSPTRALGPSSSSGGVAAYPTTSSYAAAGSAAYGGSSRHVPTPYARDAMYTPRGVTPSASDGAFVQATYGSSSGSAGRSLDLHGARPTSRTTVISQDRSQPLPHRAPSTPHTTYAQAMTESAAAEASLAHRLSQQRHLVSPSPMNGRSISAEL